MCQTRAYGEHDKDDPSGTSLKRNSCTKFCLSAKNSAVLILVSSALMLGCSLHARMLTSTCQCCMAMLFATRCQK